MLKRMVLLLMLLCPLPALAAQDISIRGTSLYRDGSGPGGGQLLAKFPNN